LRKKATEEEASLETDRPVSQEENAKYIDGEKKKEIRKKPPTIKRKIGRQHPALCHP